MREKQGGQLLQIYNMDSGNAMELDPHVDPNESVPARQEDSKLHTNSVSVGHVFLLL